MQRGKCAADAIFAVRMRHCHRCVAEKTWDIVTPKDFVEVLRYKDGTANSILELIAIDRNGVEALKWKAATEKVGSIATLGKHMIYEYEDGDDAEMMTMWCEEYNGPEPIQCKIGMYSCVVVSREVEADSDEHTEESKAMSMRSAGLTAERADRTVGTLVNTEFIGANRNISDGVKMGQTTIFVGSMNGVKIISTSSIVLRAKQTYPSSVKSEIQGHLLGRCDEGAGAYDDGGTGFRNIAAEVQDDEYHLYGHEGHIDDVGDDGEESEDLEYGEWMKAEARLRDVAA